MTEAIPCPAGPFRIAARKTPPAVRLSLVLPTYNEAENIRQTIEEAHGILSASVGPAFEIIVVDDDSPDRTADAALDMTRTLPNLKVMVRKEERGLSSAVLRGWQAAEGDVLGVMDADFQHPPRTLSALWAEISRGADLAVASRHVAGGGVSEWSISRRIISRGAQLTGLVLLPEVLLRVSDPMSGYFLVRRSAVEGVTFTPRGYKVLVEVLARGRARRIGEAGYVFRERSTGSSKLTGRIYLDYLAELVCLRLASISRSRFLRFLNRG